MKYLNGALVILLSIHSITYQGYSQTKPSQQKSIITTKLVVLKYKDHSDTLVVPVVSDKYPALSKALSYKNIFYGDDLPDVIKNYANCECGITGLDYQVTFENKNILSIIIYIQTAAAYPDNSEEWFTFNINTGEAYPIKNEIDPKGLKWIFNSYKIELKKRILNDKKENEDENIDGYNELKTTVDSLKSDELFGKYVFTKKGITFSIEKILPHVMNAVEPDRDVLFPYDKLKLYKTSTAIVIK
jgi:hypothetical protein